MRIALMVVMLISLLIVSYLVVHDITSRSSGDKAVITAIDKAQKVRDRVDEAGKEMEKRMDKAVGE